MGYGALALLLCCEPMIKLLVNIYIFLKKGEDENGETGRGRK